MNRCYTPTNKDFPSIGGAGVRVHPAWHEFSQFLADMGERPDGSVLNRVDPTKDFEPGNCHWQPLVHARNNRVYGIWKSMRRRCGVIGVAPDPGVTHYMARGIAVYAPWATSFTAFYAHVGEPPTPQHQLDRIDNARGYEPGNVRWATPKENANNRSDNVYIEIDGVRRTLQQWCDHYGVDPRVVRARWFKLFSAKVQKHYRPCQQLNPITGRVIAEHASIKDAAKATGIQRGTISKCLSGGNATAGGFAWRYIE